MLASVRLQGSNSKKGFVGAGAYRHLQARLRNNAESVAFYGGVEKEGRMIVHRFKELLRHHERLLRKQWQFGMVQVSLMLPPPPFFLGPPLALGPPVNCLVLPGTLAS